MQTVSFWQAWGLWFDGQSVAGYRLWGVPVLWWGRIGKLGQFTGGLVAIIDIIGVTRISAWGERLRARPVEGHRRTLAETWRRRREIYGDVYQELINEFLRYRATKSGSLRRRGVPAKRVLEPEARRVKRIVDITYWLLALGGFGAAIIWDNTDHAGGPEDLAWYWMVLIVAGTLAVILTWVWILMAALTVFSLATNLVSRAWPLLGYALFVWPPLVLLRGPQPDRSLRVIGVLLVVAGFGFDLLAS